jgi:hypothetical protein
MSTSCSRSGEVRVNRGHWLQYSVEAMCCVLEVATSGCYDWLKEPVSKRA